MMQYLEMLKNLSLIFGVFVGLGTLIFHFHSLRQVARQNVLMSFFIDVKSINDFISNNQDNLKAPPYPELKSGQTTGMLIFHHLNLVFRFWSNRKLMKKEEILGFERWMKIIFFEWIKSDLALSRDLMTIIEFKDFYPDKFLIWLEGHPEYKIIQRELRKSQK